MAGYKLGRRAWLAATAGTLLSVAAGAAAEPRHAVLRSPHFELRDITLPGDKRVGTRMVLLLPKHTQKRVPLLVLLHGLGETGGQRMGAYAWVERYGLGSSYERLLAPPVQPLYSRAKHWKKEQLAQVNKQLAEHPFGGMAIACPYTPNVYKAARRGQLLDRYARWIVEEVVPRARREAHVYQDATHTYLDGCSLGGYVGIEVFLRAPEHFCAWGSVQGALGKHRIAAYARRLQEVVSKHGNRFIHLETSTADPFRDINRRLAADLKKRGVAHDFITLRGPHNQPFLRDSGTLQMLLWHDGLRRRHD